MSDIAKRNTRELETGKLEPYPWGRGWRVIPRVGGHHRAQCYGIGLAPTLAEGKQRLAHLATTEDDGYDKRSDTVRWSPPARCAYAK